MSRAFAILFLLALSLGIYLGTTSAPALVDEADCAHAIAARELRESGDWAVLHINGIRYLEKAPLHYWLVAASYKILGESDFSTRLPLALAEEAPSEDVHHQDQGHGRKRKRPAPAENPVAQNLVTRAQQPI